MKGMIMKTKQFMVAVLAVCLAGSVWATGTRSITLTAEADRSILLADQPEHAYLRIGLTGCRIEDIEKRATVNVAIVIDKSGSMSSDGKMEKAKEAALLALDRLGSQDILSIVAYDDEVEVLLPATKLTDKNAVREKIRQLQPGGSTALHAGVQKGAKEVRKFLAKEKVNRIVLLSDGLANVGPSSSEELGRVGSGLGEEGISVTTIGLGLGYNEDLMSKLAFNSDGGHYFVRCPNELAEIFDKEFSRAMSVVAQDVRIEIICGEGMRPVRILGRQGQIDGRTANLDIQNIYSEHEKYVILEIELPAHSQDKVRELANVRVNYYDVRTHTAQKAADVVNVRFSESKADVESTINKRVMANVVELLAVERNEAAMRLRDEGQIDQAQQMLRENSLYLKAGAKEYDSPSLDGYGTSNASQAEQLDDKDWNSNRKVMVEEQAARKSQR
jgi:Ca-activated chloride channel family protein